MIEAPIKDITTAETTVSVQSGQTIVLGGMITNDIAVVARKVPWLGDIPLVGRLFRYDLQRHRRKELLVFLTPIVLEDDMKAEFVKTQEVERIHMPAEAWSFGDNLTGIYSDVSSVVGAPDFSRSGAGYSSQEPEINANPVMPLPAQQMGADIPPQAPTTSETSAAAPQMDTATRLIPQQASFRNQQASFGNQNVSPSNAGQAELQNRRSSIVPAAYSGPSMPTRGSSMQARDLSAQTLPQAAQQSIQDSRTLGNHGDQRTAWRPLPNQANSSPGNTSPPAASQSGFGTQPVARSAALPTPAAANSWNPIPQSAVRRNNERQEPQPQTYGPPAGVPAAEQPRQRWWNQFGKPRSQPTTQPTVSTGLANPRALNSGHLNSQVPRPELPANAVSF